MFVPLFEHSHPASPFVFIGVQGTLATTLQSQPLSVARDPEAGAVVTPDASQLSEIQTEGRTGAIHRKRLPSRFLENMSKSMPTKAGKCVFP